MGEGHSHSGVPQLSNAPGDIAVMPSKVKYISPPTAREQLPMRSRGPPTHRPRSIKPRNNQFTTSAGVSECPAPRQRMSSTRHHHCNHRTHREKQTRSNTQRRSNANHRLQHRHCNGIEKHQCPQITVSCDAGPGQVCQRT